MNVWKKKVQDFTGIDALIWTAELMAAIYGIMGIVLFWSSIVDRCKEMLTKIKWFITGPKEEN